MTSPEAVPCLNNCCISPSPPLCEMASACDSFFNCVNYVPFVALCMCFFLPDVVVKCDSYYGVLMAYGGLQDVRGSHHINLVSDELLFS